jgi:hypothetical protein
MFAIKIEISDPSADTFVFRAQKTMYGGKHIAKDDAIFVFASENEGGSGLIASGVVTSKGGRQEERDRAADAARQCHGQTRTYLKIALAG